MPEGLGWQPLDLSPDDVDITQLLKQCRYVSLAVVLQRCVSLTQLLYAVEFPEMRLIPLVFVFVFVLLFRQ